MENNPKKSKAFIIAFIIILLLLICGYYLFKNRAQIFDAKGSTSISKIFAPLLGSSKSKDLKTIDITTDDKGNKTIQGEAGEDIKKGDTVYVSGFNKNNKPILMKAKASDLGNKSLVFGIAAQDMSKGSSGTANLGSPSSRVSTDANGNRIVRGEAGEDLKKGDLVYIFGFNASNQPILMKALASDKDKSLVFGVAGEDINKGSVGDIIVDGLLSGVNTSKTEGTPWAVEDTLYLSDKTAGAMTKNPPSSPSFVVPVGNVIKIDPVNGEIDLSNITKMLTDFINNTDQLINNLTQGLSDYLKSIFNPEYKEIPFNPDDFNGSDFNFNFTPIKIPGSENNFSFGDFPSVTVTATPSSIKSGETSTITWTSVNTTSCTLSGGGLTGTGTENKVGVKTGALTKSMSYTVSCTGANGRNSGNVTVFVDTTKIVPNCTLPKKLDPIKNTC